MTARLLGNEAVRTIFLVARREFLTRARTRIFLIGTVLLAGLMVGYIIVQDVFISKAVTTVKLGFTGGAAVFAQPLVRAAGSSGLKIVTSTWPDVAAGEDQVRAGKIDALVSGDQGAPDVSVMSTLNPTVGANLNALVKQVALTRALTASGADPAAIETQVAAAGIHLRALDPNAAIRTQRTVVGVFVAVVLYVALLVYGQLVAAGVVEEKSSRIIEILLSTVRARQLLFGKVIGIGLVGLLQLVFVGGVGLIAATRTQVIDVPDVGVVSVLGGLLWFVLGFVFFALLFAAGGSMVSRQEDLASVTMPITMLIVGTYLAFFWVVANPASPIGILLSILPPFAPVLMPARIATGDAAAWQVVVAVGLMIGAILALNWLAARIYVNSVLRVGSRVRLSQAWRGAD